MTTRGSVAHGEVRAHGEVLAGFAGAGMAGVLGSIGDGSSGGSGSGSGGIGILGLVVPPSRRRSTASEES